MTRKIFLRIQSGLLIFGVLCLWAFGSGAQSESGLRSLPEGALSSSITVTPVVIDVLEVQEMPVRQVLELIRIKTGISMDIPAGLSGLVTIYLQNVDVRDALRIILDTNGLAYYEQGGVFKVVTAADYEKLYGQKFGQNIQTRIIPLLHTSLESARMFIEELKSPEGRVVINTQSNSFVVTDVPERLDAMEDFIKARDMQVETKTLTLRHVALADIRQEIDQVLTPNVGRIELSQELNVFRVLDSPLRIEQIVTLVEQLDKPQWVFDVRVRTIQITLEDEHLDGVDWEAIVTKYKTISFPNADKLLPENPVLQLGTVSNEDVVVLLDALETVGLVHMVQDITVIVSDNEEKSFVVRFMEDDSDPADDPLEEVRYFIRPRAVANGSVDFRVRPQFAFRDKFEFGRKVTSSESITLGKEETIVVGSFFREIRIDSLWKIPLLGDLPILGFAFRNQYKEKRRSEVIMLLTPVARARKIL